MNMIMKFAILSLLIVCALLFSKAKGAAYVEQCLNSCKTKGVPSIHTLYCCNSCVSLPFATVHDTKEDCKASCTDAYTEVPMTWACRDACKDKFPNE